MSAPVSRIVSIAALSPAQARGTSRRASTQVVDPVRPMTRAQSPARSATTTWSPAGTVVDGAAAGSGAVQPGSPPSGTRCVGDQTGSEAAAAGAGGTAGLGAGPACGGVSQPGPN